jgi:glycosyltransferase involved in cell wall biosynthesis
VIICTRNRAAQLAHALDSVANLRTPKRLRWEVIVVDNGSSDNTAEVAESFRDRLPIRVVREDTPGLSNARNRGVEEAAGAYICWTDDDLLLDPNWLEAYATAFKRHPEAAVFGGKIIPILQAPTPDWFRRFADEWPLTTLLANRDLGDDIRPLTFEGGEIPWGANFAVRTAEQRRARFEPSLGVSPLQRRLGEESEAIFRMMKAGAVGWWVPDSAVRHIIPTQRQTWRYVYDYFLSCGETIAYMERAWPGAHHMAGDQREMARVSGSAVSLYARAAASGLLYMVSRLVGATRRSLQLLALTGLYVGAARFAAAGRPTMTNL